MEQIQQLIEILEKTPEMALWGLGIYFLFILLKLASWVYALKVVIQQLIKRFFDYKEKNINNKRGVEIAEMFEKCKISGVEYRSCIELLEATKFGGRFIHESDIRRAIKLLKEANN